MASDPCQGFSVPVSAGMTGQPRLDRLQPGGATGQGIPCGLSGPIVEGTEFNLPESIAKSEWELNARWTLAEEPQWLESLRKI